jgi:triosephosphate isomerase
LAKSVTFKLLQDYYNLSFPHISVRVNQAVAGSNVKVSAQNCFYEQKGAFTGAVSAPMLKSLGLQYTLIGHSERRKIFSEQDSDINKVVRSVQAAGLNP